MSAMLKIFRQTLFALILIIGASLATFAQSNDNKNTKPPDKKEVPVVPVQPKEKPPKENSPNNDNSNKPKKPSAELSGNLQTITLIIA
jgi:hypothetical protein